MITINISDDNWKKLNQLKNVGETFDEVLTKIISQASSSQKEVKEE
jgi:predicted CopG family antitoxin